MAQRALVLVVVALLCGAAAVEGKNAEWDSIVMDDQMNGLCGDLVSLEDGARWTTQVPEYLIYDQYGNSERWYSVIPSYNCKWEYRGKHTNTIALVAMRHLAEGGTVKVYNDTYATSDSLQVKEGGWAGISFQMDGSTQSPSFKVSTGSVNWTMHADRLTPLQPEDAQGSFECLNGGNRNSVGSNAFCQCPPGFAGQDCVRGCGPDRYGPDCENQCSGTLRGCQGFKFSRASTADIIETCVAGFSGSRCDSKCRNGTYGADCAQTCGKCDDGASCDPYTGYCPTGCQAGFGGLSCHHDLLHLVDGLNITSVTETSISGSVTISPENVAGRGTVKYLEVQTKEPDQPVGTWEPQTRKRLILLDKCTQRADTKSAETPVTMGCTYGFTVTGLRRGTTFDVRVLLLDGKLYSFTNVPYVRATTSGRRRVRSPTATAVTSTSMHINWTSVNLHHNFLVTYECLWLEGCNAPCPAQAAPAEKWASPGVVQPAEGGEARVAYSAVLEGLTPATRYLMLVRRNAYPVDEDAYIEVTTLPAAPSAAVAGLRVERVTNSSAALRWDRLRCGVDAVHAPVLGYRWLLSTNGISSDDDSNSSSSSLSSKAENFTADPMTVLLDLDPLTSYKLSVAVVNSLGTGPETQIEFTTLPTVPDAPRDLSAYRFNRTSLWLRWRPPARPSGALRHYTLTAQPVAGASAAGEVQRPAREERVNASTAACAAYPGWVCASLHRLRPGEYALAVSATNEHADHPGQRAETSFSTAAALRTASPPPRQLEAWRVTADAVWLRWRQPESFRSDPFYFQVKVIRQLDDAATDASSADLDLLADPEPTRVHVDEEKEVYEFVADHLQPNTKYQVEVGCGYGGTPATVDVTTAQATTPLTPTEDSDPPLPSAE